MRDLRSFLQLLDDRGELVRISREVNPKFEMPALMVQLEKAGKAFVFENVSGAAFPLTGGLLSNAR
ncbi:MAG: UbiD family decarboxylase, partial [Gammaproteobacteria bacterium]|nr:UbiD family decarboxylase [Gammaproteobacteria bacterium]